MRSTVILNQKGICRFAPTIAVATLKTPGEEWIHVEYVALLMIITPFRFTKGQRLDVP